MSQDSIFFSCDDIRAALRLFEGMTPFAVAAQLKLKRCKGIKGHPTRCPLAIYLTTELRGLGFDVDPDGDFAIAVIGPNVSRLDPTAPEVNGVRRAFSLVLPHNLVTFVYEFDDGHHPDLIY